MSASTSEKTQDVYGPVLDMVQAEPPSGSKRLSERLLWMQFYQHFQALGLPDAEAGLVATSCAAFSKSMRTVVSHISKHSA